MTEYQTISEVNSSGTGTVTVKGTITEVKEPRTVDTKSGESLRVADATLKDETGEVKLSLWGDEIDTYKTGDNIEIQKGYAKEWKGTVSVSRGKFGTMLKSP